jgi:uncharacterized protein YaiI (UPF0178 family)
MNIWVDADACPKAIKQVLFKAADRLQVPLTLVANQYIPTPPSKVIRSIQVAQGFDVADNAIVERVVENDLVITGDIPLAAEVVEKGATALNPRGTLLHQGKRQRLSATSQSSRRNARYGRPSVAALPRWTKRMCRFSLTRSTAYSRVPVNR